jgi:transcriptional regulator
MKADALRGHLDALILATVETGALHGYAIAESLAARSDGALDVATGTLYPALRRLETAGLLSSAWSTVGGRKRRTYRLTASGRKALARERSAWRDLAGVVDAVLRPGTA